jgi:hypothetical protein
MTHDDCSEVISALKRMRDDQHTLQLRHVLLGVEGYAEFALPYLTDGRNAHLVAKPLFKVLKDRSVTIARAYKRILLGRREGENSDATIASIDAEIEIMDQMIDDYDDFFGPEDCVLFHRAVNGKLARGTTRKRKHSD